MTNNAVEDWVREWFKANSSVPWEDGFWASNYFEVGIIDSLSVINLIEALESHFAIRLPPEVFQDRRFSQMPGLAEIITELTSRRVP